MSNLPPLSSTNTVRSPYTKRKSAQRYSKLYTRWQKGEIASYGPSSETLHVIDRLEGTQRSISFEEPRRRVTFYEHKPSETSQSRSFDSNGNMCSHDNLSPKNFYQIGPTTTLFLGGAINPDTLGQRPTSRYGLSSTVCRGCLKVFRNEVRFEYGNPVFPSWEGSGRAVDGTGVFYVSQKL